MQKGYYIQEINDEHERNLYAEWLAEQKPWKPFVQRAILFIILMIIAFASFGQKLKFFTNINSELCYELKRTNNRIYYIVIDNETTTLNDSSMFKKMNINKMAFEGRRIEMENLDTFRWWAPYFKPTAKIFPKLSRINMTIDMRWQPATDKYGNPNPLYK